MASLGVDAVPFGEFLETLAPTLVPQRSGCQVNQCFCPVTVLTAQTPGLKHASPICSHTLTVKPRIRRKRDDARLFDYGSKKSGVQPIYLVTYNLHTSVLAHRSEQLYRLGRYL